MSRPVVKSNREEDDVPGLALGMVVFIVLLSVALFILSVCGGCAAIAKCHVTLGIYALVFTVFFPPLGLILAIAGFCMGDNCLKALPTSVPVSLPTSLS
jgi:hypothetical protein